MDLKVTIQELKKGYVLVAFAGEMDAYSSVRFKDAVSDLIKKEKHKLIVDMEKVTCIDSIGAGRLLGALERTRKKKGNMWLIYHKSKVKRFLEITGLDKKFTIFQNKREAYKKLSLN